MSELTQALATITMEKLKVSRWSQPKMELDGMVACDGGMCNREVECQWERGGGGGYQ